MSAIRKTQDRPAIPYTIKMGMAEAQVRLTLCVMFRSGVHDQQWEVASNMMAGMGLTQEQAYVVYDNALEWAKRGTKA